jgi:hypothetical protein
MRRLAIPTVIASAVMAATAGLAQTQTADEIVEKHLAALGGRPALAKLTSRHTTGTVTISVQGNDISGPYSQWTKAPNKSRMFLTIDTAPLGGPGEMTIDQRFDGTSGVMINSMLGDSVITGNQLDNMRNDGFPTPMLTYKDRGWKIAVLPREKVDGLEMIVLESTPKAGSAARLYIDPATFLVARAVSRISTPELGEFENRLDFSDYRVVDGVKIAFHTVNTIPVQTVTFKIAKVAHNVAIDDATFVKK